MHVCIAVALVLEGGFFWENTPFVWSRDMDSHYAGSRENEYEKSFLFSCLIRFAVICMCMCM